MDFYNEKSGSSSVDEGDSIKYCLSWQQQGFWWWNTDYVSDSWVKIGWTAKKEKDFGVPVDIELSRSE